MKTKNKFIRKSTVERYFKALQILYYRVVILKQNNLSLNKFTVENNLAGSTAKSFIELSIIKNNNTVLNPDLVWLESKPTKLMAEMIVRYNKSKIIRSQKNKSNLQLEIENIIYELKTKTEILQQLFTQYKS